MGDIALTNIDYESGRSEKITTFYRQAIRRWRTEHLNGKYTDDTVSKFFIVFIEVEDSKYDKLLFLC